MGQGHGGESRPLLPLSPRPLNPEPRTLVTKKEARLPRVQEPDPVVL